MKERVVLHSDLNNCYASIECMLQPALKGKRIAVCGSVDDRHGIVLAKNQEAKKFGVKTGMAIWQAKQVCPELTIVPPQMDQYIKFSKIVREIYLRYSPEVESFGIDESWIELTGSPMLEMKTPLEIANDIRETVKQEVGLTVSIGVSFNKIFAKLGSDMKKPDAVTCIPRDHFQEIVWPLPVEDLLYVGRATAEKLHRRVIRTIGDLAQTDPKSLEYLLGKNGILKLRYGKPDLSVVESFEKGIITLHNAIESKCNSQFGRLLEGSDINEVIQNQPTMLPGEVQMLIRQMADEFLSDFFHFLRERGIDVATSRCLFSGGGSILLRTMIERSGKVAYSVFDDDVHANAVGYQLLYQSEVLAHGRE